MGAGFAFLLDPKDVGKSLAIAEAEGYDAWPGGVVAKDLHRKTVEIAPLNITFDADTLQVR
jgi:hypothetical protein